MPKTTPVSEKIVENTTSATTTPKVKKVRKVRVSKKKVEEVAPVEENVVVNNESNVVEQAIVQEEQKPVVVVEQEEQKPVVEQEEETNEDETTTTTDKKKTKKLSKEEFIPKWDYLFEAYATELKAARKQPNQNVSLLKYLTQLKNDTYKFLKLRKRNKDTDKTSGFLKPVAISDELQNFFGGKRVKNQLQECISHNSFVITSNK